MIKLIDCISPSQIDDVNNILHDCWFSISDISYDNNILVIPFEYIKYSGDNVVKRFFIIKKQCLPVYQANLYIHHVVRYDISDKWQIDKYDFNVLFYDENVNSITITTGCSNEITIDICHFNIHVDITDKILRYKNCYSIWPFY